MTARESGIRLVLCDVDGVLTDGGLVMIGGTEEARRFHPRDGHAIKLAIRLGLPVGVISGKRAAAVEARVAQLGLDPVHLGVRDKLPLVQGLLEERGLDWSQLAFIGDDLPDLPVIRRAGWGVAVRDANPLVRRRADWITDAGGGAGAVAELLERLLRVQGRWASAMTDGQAARG